jgi:WD40 repeat protein
VTTGATILELRGHEENVNSVSFSHDGLRIVSGSSDGTIRIWDATSGAEVVPPLRDPDDAVTSVAFSPDGTKLISGSLDRTIRIWDVSAGTEIHPTS